MAKSENTQKVFKLAKALYTEFGVDVEDAFVSRQQKEKI